jgi:hypothetical protein
MTEDEREIVEQAGRLFREELRLSFVHRDIKPANVVGLANENLMLLTPDEHRNLSFSRELDEDDVEYLSKLMEQDYTPHADFSTPRAQPGPSVLAEALVVLFGPKRRVDAILGDLTERFNEDCAAKGVRHAQLLSWTRVLRSIGPLLWARIRNAGVIAVVFEIGHRWMGS